MYLVILVLEENEEYFIEVHKCHTMKEIRDTHDKNIDNLVNYYVFNVENEYPINLRW